MKSTPTAMTYPVVAAKASEERTPSSQPAKAGDVETKVLSASVGTITSKGRIPGVSKTEFLLVTVEVVLVNPNKKMEYKTWNWPKQGGTLKDNFGNSYEPFPFGSGTFPDGGVEDVAVLYPSKPVKDVLVFERPIDTATHLDLDIPAKNLGAEGTIRFRIPVSAITKMP